VARTYHAALIAIAAGLAAPVSFGEGVDPALRAPVHASSTAPTPASPLAADFALEAIDGRNVRLSEYRGDAVVVTFWGSWCGPCRASLVTLDAFAQQSGTPVLGVNLDGTLDRAAAVATSLRLSYPTLVDTNQRVARTYDVSKLPLTLAIDRDGAVRAAWSGRAVDGAELTRTLHSIIPE
jgi:peroxiredoxin